ncbi:hypothetical protein HGM15179_017654 [Zosterops borbonicus]|uniref:Reverse transcriptase domain-containing protein n=1 Tax=Zosterops borbonicus TaxID=364589 RepID=A0A8K1LD57_9PASS|nr:hypothetical protein HGM15179_017654 [Zosterops borbonicus]
MKSELLRPPTRAGLPTLQQLEPAKPNKTLLLKVNPEGLTIPRDTLGTILGPVLFNIIINALDTGYKWILSKFTDDTELGESVDSLEGREALQRDIDKLEDRAITSCMKFNKGKCQILHLGQDNSGYTDRLGNKRLESSAMERHLEVLVDGNTINYKGTILGPVLFNIIINALDTGYKWILSKFTDDTELGESVDSLEGREALQRDIDKLEDRAITSCMKFNKGKCQILHLGQDNSGYTDRLGNKRLESSAMERHLEVLVDGK